jgi:hypothetical protein
MGLEMDPDVNEVRLVDADTPGLVETSIPLG